MNTTLVLELRDEDVAQVLDLLKGIPVKQVMHTYRPAELKHLRNLQGRVVHSIKGLGSKSGVVYIQTTDGKGIALESVKIKEKLGAEDILALGILTKEDLASIAKARKLGVTV